MKNALRPEEGPRDKDRVGEDGSGEEAEKNGVEILSDNTSVW